MDANLGKCRAWSAAGGPAPPGIVDLGPDVWRGDRTSSECGLKILGAPLGSDEFIDTFLQERIRDEALLIDRLAYVQDLQCAWLILSMCAAKRANHLLRVLPPSIVTNYAQQHDDCIWRGLCQLLEDNNPNTFQSSMHRSIAEIPVRAGGLGLGNSGRTSSAAYWAAWADALPVLISKLPEDARSLQRQLESPQ